VAPSCPFKVFAPPRVNLKGLTMNTANAEPKIVPTWGYHATDPARIFDLGEGHRLPAGWHDHPDKAKAKPKPQRRPAKTGA
jgi:hypothetical protein